MTDQSGAAWPSDAIRAVWEHQDDANVGSLLDSDPEAMVDLVVDAHQKDQRKLFWLNLREVIPSIGVAAAFALGAPGAERPGFVLAAAILTLAVGVFLLTWSIRHHRADRCYGSGVREQLARRLAQVRHRDRLFGTVGWWYFVPLGAAVVLASFGFSTPEEPPWTFLAFVAVGSVMLYAINVAGSVHEPRPIPSNAVLAPQMTTPV